MKKIRIWLAAVLVLLLGGILFSTFSDRTPIITGLVNGFEGESFTVITEKGKTYEFVGFNHILSWVDGFERDDFPREDLQVSVTYSKTNGQYYAELVTVDAVLTRGARELEDGTRIDVWGNDMMLQYCLEDGTELLVEYEPITPDRSAGFDSVSESALNSIVSYYEEKGLCYDIDQLLEEAYAVYSMVGEQEYLSRVVSQDVHYRTGNARIACFGLSVSTPIAMTNSENDEIVEGAVFDRETGEHINNFDLFTCTPEELEEFLLDQLNLTEKQRKVAALNLQPENILLGSDGSLGVHLRQYSIPDFADNLVIGLHAEDFRHLLQPWAVIETGENEP